MGRNTVLMTYNLNLLLILSVVPFKYGKNALWLLSSAVGVSEGFSVFLNALCIAFLLQPFSFQIPFIT